MSHSKTETTPKNFILSQVRQMQGYSPGFQPQEQEGFVKLNTNESPFPPSSKVVAALEQALQAERLHLYPDPKATKLRQAIARSYDLSENYVMIGNGSDELLSLLFRATLSPGDKVISCDLTYSLYPILAQTVGAVMQQVALQEDWHVDFQALAQAVNFSEYTTSQTTDKTLSKRQKLPTSNSQYQRQSKLVILANPNAPTSIAESFADILDFTKQNAALTLIDEAYAPFMEASLGSQAGSREYPRLLVCSTFSKAYSLAGQRIGWLIAHPDIITELDKLRDSYNVNYLSQVAALAAWEDKAELKRRIYSMKGNRDKLLQGLKRLGFTSLPPSANFIFTKPPPDIGAAEDYTHFLKKHKILVRHFKKPRRASSHVRITIGNPQEIEKILSVTEDWRSSQ